MGSLFQELDIISTTIPFMVWFYFATGCGVCHRTVVDSGLVLDGVAYHILCCVCVACGKSANNLASLFDSSPLDRSIIKRQESLQSKRSAVL